MFSVVPAVFLILFTTASPTVIPFESMEACRSAVEQMKVLLHRPTQLRALCVETE